jgi:hypothetical protein
MTFDGFSVRSIPLRHSLPIRSLLYLSDFPMNAEYYRMNTRCMIASRQRAL